MCKTLIIPCSEQPISSGPHSHQDTNILGRTVLGTQEKKNQGHSRLWEIRKGQHWKARGQEKYFMWERRRKKSKMMGEVQKLKWWEV